MLPAEHMYAANLPTLPSPISISLIVTRYALPRGRLHRGKIAQLRMSLVGLCEPSQSTVTLPVPSLQIQGTRPQETAFPPCSTTGPEVSWSTESR